VKRFLIRMLALTAFVLGQSPPAIEPIPVVTVCEISNDFARFEDMAIIVVGLESDREGGSLSANCTTSSMAGWISIPYFKGSGQQPPHLPNLFKWDAKLLATKLEKLRRSSQSPPHADQDTGWTAIFGRLEILRVYADPVGWTGSSLGLIADVGNREVYRKLQ
jgi:hypothetical protein